MGSDRFTGDTENEEWAAWYRLSMEERWRESMKLWQFYLSVGGSLAPEPDPQSPFYSDDDSDFPVNQQPDMNALWRERMKSRRSQSSIAPQD
jgi:hypothetical protein